MGYNVVDGGNPHLSQIPLMQLRNADLIVLGAPEWFAGEVRKHYGSVWNTLRAKKAAWYAESFHRDDQDFNFNSVRDLADFHYFPAIQDAEEFGGQWLNPAERDAIAAAGRAHVTKNHAMRLPLRKILDDAESGAHAASSDPWEAAISKLAKR